QARSSCLGGCRTAGCCVGSRQRQQRRGPPVGREGGGRGKSLRDMDPWAGSLCASGKVARRPPGFPLTALLLFPHPRSLRAAYAEVNETGRLGEPAAPFVISSRRRPTVARHRTGSGTSADRGARGSGSTPKASLKSRSVRLVSWATASVLPSCEMP